MSPVVNVYSTSVTTENISRFELLAWVNDCLQSNLTKIEEMGTGAAYCQLTDFLFPTKVPLKKVKWSSRNDVDWLNNWRVLQHAWKEIGIDKPVPVQSLMRAKFQDNFEFLQWFKKFFDANYDGHEYDPIAARNYEEFPAALPGGGAKKALTSRRSDNSSTMMIQASAAGTTRQLRNISGSGSSTLMAPTAQSRARASTQTSKPASTLLAARRPSPRISATSAAGATPPSHTSSTGRVTTTNGRPPVGAIGKTPSAIELTKLRQKQLELEARNVDLEAQLTQERERSCIFERERNFYLDKLRTIEILCGECAYPSGGGKLAVEQVQAILWEQNEGVASTVTTNGEGDASGRTHSPQPRGDIFSQPICQLDSSDTQQVHKMGLNNSHCVQHQNASDEIGSLNTAHLEDTFLLDEANSTKQHNAFTIQQQAALELSTDNNSLSTAYTYNANQLDQVHRLSDGNVDSHADPPCNVNAFGDEVNITHPVEDPEILNLTQPLVDGVATSGQPVTMDNTYTKLMGDKQKPPQLHAADESSFLLELAGSEMMNIIDDPPSGAVKQRQLPPMQGISAPTQSNEGPIIADIEPTLTKPRQPDSAV